MLTFTNKWLINIPTRGPSTNTAKLLIPVANANTVASIRFGVILAKSTIVGNYRRANVKVEEAASVNITRAMSLTPISKFNLRTKIRFAKLLKKPAIIDPLNKLLNSDCVKYYLYRVVPSNKVTNPSSASKLNVNLLKLITLI